MISENLLRGSCVACCTQLFRDIYIYIYMSKDLGSGIIASIALFNETVRHSLGISHKLLLLLLIQYMRYQSCNLCRCWREKCLMITRRPLVPA